MPLYFNPPGHLPVRVIYKRKGLLPGMQSGVLVLMMMLMPLTHVTAATPDHKQAQQPQSKQQKDKHHPRENTYMKRKWGVELLFVRETSANYMLEFRYKVLDANKAKPLFERQTKPVLTHVRTGAKLIVPTPAKTGALRNSNSPKTGKVYWMFFANPGKLVKPGEQVNIAIGEFHADGLIVQ
jgi:hypothetical protein